MNDLQRKLSSYEARIASLARELGIPRDYGRRNLPVFQEAQDLVQITSGPLRETFQLTPRTLSNWESMSKAATSDGVSLYLTAGFRTIEQQADLIRSASQQTGCPVESVLDWILAPGYSEHHTGRAIDIGFADCGGIPTAEFVETTPRFKWLTEQASKFGFRMSYPRGNSFGVVYEPWHWCLEPDE